MKRILSAIFGLLSFTFSAIAQVTEIPEVKQTVFKTDTVNISSFGAKGDGLFLNTKSIASAINSLAKSGGGVVVVPKGLWLTGPIVLQSNINLHVANGATLLFTADKSQYALVTSNWEGLPQMRNQSPISATNATNIAITGKGIIDGNGDGWRSVKREKLNETQWKKLVASGGLVSEDKKNWYPSQQFFNASKLDNPGVITPPRNAAYFENIKDFLRPNMVVLTGCKTILLEGVTFQNSAAWCLHPLMSEDLTVRNIFVKNPWYAQNGDGIDVESCKNVLIENSIFDVGDDALCMKSGRDEAGRQRAMPTENVVIRGCTVYASHGGFVIGSEMSGGAKNIYVNNCTFIGTDIGLRFKTTRGRGGIVENIFIKDIYTKDIVGEAILFDMYYAAKDPIPLAGEKRELPKVEFLPVDATTPIFKNFHISNVYVNGAEKAIFVRGLPEMHIENIVLDGMVMQTNKGVEVQEATNVKFKNLNISTEKTNPVIEIIQSDNLLFDNINFKNKAEQFVIVNGERSNNILIKNTNTATAIEPIKFELGATNKSTLIEAYQVASFKWSEALTTTAMNIWPDSFTLAGDKIAKWRYDQGVILKGVEAIWKATGDGKWFNYLQRSMDFYVQQDGTIKGYKTDEYNLDHINNGRILLLLSKVTGKEKYKKAADLLREQFRTHPRTKEGGFWHKKIYPSQMWLDGLYMAEPFYAEYAKLYNDEKAFDDIANQFILVEKNTRDSKTGLLYHGWDESKEQQWANKKTGQSPNFWGRSLGWYGMALVDVLDYFPANHPKRKEILNIIQRFASAVQKIQDPTTGLWYDVANQPNLKGNYLEASASSMLTYFFAKASRLGYLPKSYEKLADKGYAGILKQFIKTEKNGQAHLSGTVAVSGLGGKPYRDGSADYYLSEPVIDDDPKGLGAFIQCAAEMELIAKQKFAVGKTVLLDNYFNNEFKNDAIGKKISYHYTLEDESNSGFARLGDIFNQYGANITELNEKPTASLLNKASIYLIVDPDNEKETTNPNFVDAQDVTTIKNWVKNGGTLVLLSNDAGNAEFKNFNLLSKEFGITFNEDNKNLVTGNNFEQGLVSTPHDHFIFGSSKKLYIKEYSSLVVSSPAKAVVTNGMNNVMAVSQYGKGTVFALGDPWIYNEYLDGRKLSSDFQNFDAATAWVKWLLNTSKKN